MSIPFQISIINSNVVCLSHLNTSPQSSPEERKLLLYLSKRHSIISKNSSPTSPCIFSRFALRCFPNTYQLFVDRFP
jgi:hypothetical protein